jgi:hypothetical protein
VWPADRETPNDPARGISTSTSFVGIVGWLGVIVSSFHIIVSLSQVVLLWYDPSPFDGLRQDIPALDRIDALVFRNLDLLIGPVLLFWLLAGMFSAGILWRKEWARRGLVLLLWVAVAASLLVAGVQQYLVYALFIDLPGGSAPPEFVAFQVAAGLISVLVMLVLARTAIRLRSPAIRREFR